MEARDLSARSSHPDKVAGLNQAVDPERARNRVLGLEGPLQQDDRQGTGNQRQNSRGAPSERHEEARWEEYGPADSGCAEEKADSAIGEREYDHGQRR